MLPASIAKENKTRLSQIVDLFASIAPDLVGLNAWRYQRQISPAVQEFVEALSFQHYIETQMLITRQQIAAQLPHEILVTDEDYLLGLFDLTGEIMRFAVTALSTGGLVAATHNQQIGFAQLLPSHVGIVDDLREIRSMLESLSVPRHHSMQREIAKKVEVMQSSVEKVERAAYGILVRGSERPKGWMPDLSSAELESY